MNAKTRKEIEADFLPLTWGPLQTIKQTDNQAKDKEMTKLKLPDKRIQNCKKALFKSKIYKIKMVISSAIQIYDLLFLYRDKLIWHYKNLIWYVILCLTANVLLWLKYSSRTFNPVLHIACKRLHIYKLQNE